MPSAPRSAGYQASLYKARTRYSARRSESLSELLMVQAIAVLFLLAILVSLGFGLVSLLREHGDSQRTARALTWRIGLSVALIVLLFVGYLTGFVHPHDLGQ